MASVADLKLTLRRVQFKSQPICEAKVRRHLQLSSFSRGSADWWFAPHWLLVTCDPRWLVGAVAAIVAVAVVAAVRRAVGRSLGVAHFFVLDRLFRSISGVTATLSNSIELTR